MRSKKILWTIFGFIVVNIYFLGVVVFNFYVKDGMRVIFFDVGQGDSSLIMTEDENILIDGGPDKKVIEKLDNYLPFWNRKIDVMVLTHPHADHVIGLIDVLLKYEVGEVWTTDVLHNSPEYLEFLEIMRDKGIKVKIVGRDAPNIRGISAANARIEILYPNNNLSGEKEVDNLNNTSIVLKLNYKDKSFLFTGDIEEEVEKEFCCEVGDSHLKGDCHLKELDADVLKVAHHGSNNSSSLCFLEAVKPEFAIISAGKDNDFGMPSLRVLNRLERMGIEVFRTDEDGDVIFETDGGGIKKLVRYQFSK
ncbi:MAG: ComEC/Rec2 family competence protein [bacterium]